MKKISALVLVSLFTMSAWAQSNEWVLDPAHSKIGFSVEHMVISEVDGRFTQFEMKVTEENNFEKANISVNIKTASVNTDNTQRDQHLASADFFDATKNPEIKFTSTSMEKVSGNKYLLKGNLQMNGVSKPLELDVKFGGIMKDPWGNTKAGFKITGVINRYDYNLKYNSTLEAGGLLIGQDVNLEMFIELSKK